MCEEEASWNQTFKCGAQKEAEERFSQTLHFSCFDQLAFNPPLSPTVWFGVALFYGL
jgi:hypothetical protein